MSSTNGVSLFFTVMALSGLSVYLFKQSIKNKEKSTQNSYIDAVSDFFGKIAIKILLPILFFESLIKNIDKTYEIFTGVLYGAILSFLTLIVGYLLYKFSDKRFDIEKITHVVGATYGGGNRGTVLILLAISVFFIDDSYLAYFYAVDFGNFMFFIFFIPLWLKKRVYKIDRNVNLFRRQEKIKYMLIPFSMAAILIFLKFFDNDKMLAISVVDFLDVSSAARSFLLLYFSFCLIYFGMDFGLLSAKKLWNNIIFITMSRLIAVFILSVLIFRELVFSWSILLNPYFFAIVVLFLCPPSSLFGAKICGVTNDKDDIKFSHTVVMAMVLLYCTAIGVILLIDIAAPFVN